METSECIFSFEAKNFERFYFYMVEYIKKESVSFLKSKRIFLVKSKDILTFAKMEIKSQQYILQYSCVVVEIFYKEKKILNKMCQKNYLTLEDRKNFME